MVEATRNGRDGKSGPVMYTVVFVRETMRDGVRVVETLDTGIVGSFSDCCRDKRGVAVPKGYEVVLKRLEPSQIAP